MVLADLPVTITDAWRRTVALHPSLGDSRDGIRAARNEIYAPWDAPLNTGDVVAFIPPVSGGSDSPPVTARLTSDVIDIAAEEAAARSDHDGGVCTFAGHVRDHNEGHEVSHLDYEAYESMATGEMERIARAAVESTGASRVRIVHRLGRLDIGDCSVVVVAAAPHRDQAFDACRLAIDALKRDAPIFKREYGRGGSAWVEPPVPKS